MCHQHLRWVKINYTLNELVKQAHLSKDAWRHVKQTQGFYLEFHDDTADELSLEDAMALNATWPR